MTMIGSACHISPMPPGIKSSGIKAAMDVSTAKISGTLILCAPRIAAVTPGVPRMRSRWICSETTMASSTIMPMPSTKTNSEIVLMARSSSSMTDSAPMNDTISPTVTQIASLSERNRASARNTSRRPSPPFLSSRLTRSEYVCDSSFQTVRPTPSGRDGTISSVT